MALNTSIRGQQLRDTLFGAGLVRNGTDADVMDINVDDTTVEINADQLRVKADGIGANELDETDTYDFTSGSVSVATPTSDNQAANKSYVDGLVNGLDWKNSVRLATDSALPANTAAGTGEGKTLTADVNGALSVDGVAVVVGDRILVKDEATASDNGIYEVTAAGDGSNPYVLTRATDADEDAEVTANLAVFVAEGTVNGDAGWVLSTDDPITVDTTGLTFAQFTGTGQLTAGAGLTKTGNTIDVGDANKGIQVNADDLEIDASEISGNGLSQNGTNSWELDLDVNALTAAVVDVAADSIAIVDADDSNITRKESIADLVSAIAGTGLSASSGVLSVADNIVESDFVKDVVVATGGETTLTSFSGGSAVVANSVQVYLNGLIQEEGAGNDYTLNASTGVVTFLTALEAGDIVTQHGVLDNA